MFFGEYKHKVDAKGRVLFPNKLSCDLGADFVICKSIEKCLSIYPQAAWEVYSEKIAALPGVEYAAFKRFFFSQAQRASLDDQGRLLIPVSQREFASISDDVVIIGNGDHVELWNVDEWDKSVNAINFAAFSESLCGVGI